MGLGIAGIMDISFAITVNAMGGMRRDGQMAMMVSAGQIIRADHSWTLSEEGMKS